MTTSNPGTDPAWDEAQCTSALAQLERLQAQIDDLRLTIPRLVEPFYSPPTPSVFRAYKENIATSQNDMKKLKSQWKNPQVEKIFTYSKHSFQENGDLSKSSEVPRYGWVDMEEKLQEATQKGDKEKEAESDQGMDVSQEDIRKIVDEWKARNDKIKFQGQDGYHDFKISFVSDSLVLKFHVTITQELNGVQKLRAVCLGTKEPALAITRCINTRPHPNDLSYLLDMIAAYKTVKGTKCAKCGEMFDSQVLGTVARRSREVVDGEKTNVEWEAFHEHCLV
ncbi:hypothetical protein DM02DRAFT_641908 [Periconia macrospinosa]|uniref:Uncharacterized protein n=1 Tax=Periconia macrospinosa TaxID=97972 RepID=A0A2V1DTP0_9PLEO|nr:hypothetical protein DM02DRAFT_641908 [Periconia macrospinosa]